MGRSKLNVVRDGLRFLYTILWTALNYNPVRILGGVGLGMVVIAAVIAAAVVAMRLAGITTLDPWGVAGVYIAGIVGLLGITLFSLGATFNYLVSLFHRRPIRQGLFGKPVFRRPLDRQFGWMGLVAMALGIAAGLVSLSLSFGGWPIERLWLYLLGAAMLIMVGMELTVFWIIMRVLGELNERDARITADINGQP